MLGEAMLLKTHILLSTYHEEKSTKHTSLRAQGTLSTCVCLFP